jgi:hypothetical protein
MNTFFNTILSIYSICFLIIFSAVAIAAILKRKTLARYWQLAKIKGQNQKDKIDFIKKQEAKGLKPFEFDQGKTTIYAKNGNQAISDYKRMKAKQKNRRRTKKA